MKFKTICRSIVLLLLVPLLSLLSPLTAFVQAASYTNIAPRYQTDANGTQPNPANSWTIPGQNNVVNHQGGTSSGWDGNRSWNGDPNDTRNSYIKYGSNASNPDFQIRKYATQDPTDQGLFNVHLNVKGNQQQNVTPIDIVLVVDMSGSMNPANNGGNDRVSAVRNGVRDFMEAINTAHLGSYVRVGLVGFSSPGQDDYGQPYSSAYQDLDFVSNTTQVNNIETQLNQRFAGGTFTQSGIQQGSQMLNQDTSGNKKLMILLTDGVPTFSKQVTASTVTNGTVYGTAFNDDNLDEPGFTSQFLPRIYNGYPYYNYTYYNNYGSNYIRGTDPNTIANPNNGRYYMAGSNRVWNTWAATLGQAKMAQDSGDEIHALGIQLSGDVTNPQQNRPAISPPYRTYLDSSAVRSRMQLISSTPSLYQDAGSADAVTTYLRSQANEVIQNFNTISAGSISDPIGSQFSYANPNGLTVRAAPGSAAVDTSQIAASISNASLSVSNLNLGANQEVQINYQVRINTEDPNFQPDHWYPLNGETTLTPNSANPDNRVDFGVPSGKAPGVAVNVVKRWNMLNGSAPPTTPIGFMVGRTTSASATNSWQASGTLSPGSGNSWSNSFSSLQSGGRSVYLPKFDNQGRDFTYRVTSENNVPGFSSAISNDGSTITNSQLGVNVEKYRQGSQSRLDGSQFTLTRYADNWGAADRSFTPIVLDGNQAADEAIQSGYYRLTETRTPQGYAADSTNFDFRVTDQGQFLDRNNSPISRSSADSSDGFYVKTTSSGAKVLVLAKYDTLKSFDLTVHKTDKMTNRSLSGARFTLTNSSGQSTNYAESDPTSSFTFRGLAPGTYTLRETSAPDGYILNHDPVTITIAADGRVIVSGNDTSTSSLQAGNGNNQINLTVTNAHKSIFPSTGGSGTLIYAIVSASFILIAAAASAYYLFRNRRRHES